MSDAKSPPDLSMDEILATIRRIIAEDEAGAAAPAAGAAPASGASAAAAEEAEEVLELTDAINEDGSVRRLAPIASSSRPAAGLRDPPPLAADSAVERGPEPQLLRGAPPSPERERIAGADERLVSEVTALTAAAAFARVAAAPRAPHAPVVLGDRTLDEVVRDLLRPLLQTWLDENLPAIVERLVAAEIARLARSGPG